MVSASWDVFRDYSVMGHLNYLKKPKQLVSREELLINPLATRSVFAPATKRHGIPGTALIILMPP
jgi:hypothetical protein